MWKIKNILYFIVFLFQSARLIASCENSVSLDSYDQSFDGFYSCGEIRSINNCECLKKFPYSSVEDQKRLANWSSTGHINKLNKASLDFTETIGLSLLSDVAYLETMGQTKKLDESTAASCSLNRLDETAKCNPSIKNVKSNLQAEFSKILEESPDANKAGMRKRGNNQCLTDSHANYILSRARANEGLPELKNLLNLFSDQLISSINSGNNFEQALNEVTDDGLDDRFVSVLDFVKNDVTLRVLIENPQGILDLKSAFEKNQDAPSEKLFEAIYNDEAVVRQLDQQLAKRCNKLFGIANQIVCSPDRIVSNADVFMNFYIGNQKKERSEKAGLEHFDSMKLFCDNKNAKVDEELDSFFKLLPKEYQGTPEQALTTSYESIKNINQALCKPGEDLTATITRCQNGGADCPPAIYITALKEVLEKDKSRHQDSKQLAEDRPKKENFKPENESDNQNSDPTFFQTRTSFANKFLGKIDDFKVGDIARAAGLLAPVQLKVQEQAPVSKAVVAQNTTSPTAGAVAAVTQPSGPVSNAEPKIIKQQSAKRPTQNFYQTPFQKSETKTTTAKSNTDSAAPTTNSDTIQRQDKMDWGEFERRLTQTLVPEKDEMKDLYKEYVQTLKKDRGNLQSELERQKAGAGKVVDRNLPATENVFNSTSSSSTQKPIGQTQIKGTKRSGGSNGASATITPAVNKEEEAQESAAIVPTRGTAAKTAATAKGSAGSSSGAKAKDTPAASISEGAGFEQIALFDTKLKGKVFTEVEIKGLTSKVGDLPLNDEEKLALRVLIKEKEKFLITKEIADKDQQLKKVTFLVEFNGRNLELVPQNTNIDQFSYDSIQNLKLQILSTLRRFYTLEELNSELDKVTSN